MLIIIIIWYPCLSPVSCYWRCWAAVVKVSFQALVPAADVCWCREKVWISSAVDGAAVWVHSWKTDKSDLLCHSFREICKRENWGLFLLLHFLKRSFIACFVWYSNIFGLEIWTETRTTLQQASVFSFKALTRVCSPSAQLSAHGSWLWQDVSPYLQHTWRNIHMNVYTSFQALIFDHLWYGQSPCGTISRLNTDMLVSPWINIACSSPFEAFPSKSSG